MNSKIGQISNQEQTILNIIIQIANMNPEAISNPIKNMAFLRSNSIRTHQTPTSTRPLQPTNLSLKVNQQHFPIDFFKRMKRNSTQNKENIMNLNQDKITMTQRRQGLQHFQHLLSVNKNNNICYKEQINKCQHDVDQFQITSFFQIGVDSVDTVDTVDTVDGQERVEVSDFDCGLTNHISNSIELINNRKQQDLLITFSRMPRLPSSRPPRRHANKLNPTSTQSTPIPRSSSKTDRREQNGKNSMHKIAYEKRFSQLDSQNQILKQKSIRRVTKKGETINLPPICRKG